MKYLIKDGAAKSILITLLVLPLLMGCFDRKNKQKLFAKKLVCNQLWREKFRVFSGGAYSAELYSDYLTDSMNFRIYVGSHDESSSFDYQCAGDSVFVRKFAHDGNSKIIIEEKILSVSMLKKSHKFE